ncbi:MAG: BrnA antitoxin family protein [Magnetococcus sp. DMHC-1]
MNGNTPNTATEWIDPDDAPELTDAFFEEADEYMGNQLIRRGRPAGSGTKVSTTVRFDENGVDALWSEEAESRISRYEAGKITADSLAVVLARLGQR